MASEMTAYGWVNKLAAARIYVDARESQPGSGVWGISENNGPLWYNTSDMPHRVRHVLAKER